MAQAREVSPTPRQTPSHLLVQYRRPPAIRNAGTAATRAMDSSLDLRIWSISSMADSESTFSFWTCGGKMLCRERVSRRPGRKGALVWRR